MARWIVQYIPRGRIYVEPFAGAASVFWHLPGRFPVEVLNDLDNRIVNLYRVLQDRQKFAELLHRLVWTPYSRAEFARALEVLKDPKADDVARAWAFFVAQNQGFGGKADTVGNWGRGLTKDLVTSKWMSHLKQLRHWHQRLSGVQIDSVDALQAIRYWDSPETVFYIDPPYVPETRVDNDFYVNELSMEDHQTLVETLLQVKGKVVLSGYDHPVYHPLEEAGWDKIMRETACSVAGRTRSSQLRGPGAAKALVPRVEVVWKNFKQDGALFF
jgi:DNA adenine methylase